MTDPGVRPPGVQPGIHVEARTKVWAPSYEAALEIAMKRFREYFGDLHFTICAASAVEGLKTGDGHPITWEVEFHAST